MVLKCFFFERSQKLLKGRKIVALGSSPTPEQNFECALVWGYYPPSSLTRLCAVRLLFPGIVFQINFSLLVLTLSGFGLPAYLWIYRKRLDADASKTDVEERQLFAIDEDEANEDDYSSSSDEEQAPCLSNVALAL